MNYSSIARNTMIAFAAQFISLSVSVVMSLLVPKIVGVADYGYWQLFMFYTTYSGFFHLGLNDGVYLINGVSLVMKSIRAQSNPSISSVLVSRQ